MRCFCFWHFFLPDKLLFLRQYGTSFDFRHDSLTIYDGGSNTSPMLENPYCGDSLPPSQISSSNELFFHFQSDEGFTGTGFKLEYNATSKNLYKVDFLKQCRKIQQPFFLFYFIKNTLLMLLNTITRLRVLGNKSNFLDLIT